MKSVNKKLDYILSRIKKGKLPEIKDLDLGDDPMNLLQSYYDFLLDEKLIIKGKFTTTTSTCPYVLTPKGEVFEGFVRNKLYKNIDAILKLILSMALFLAATATAIYYGHEIYILLKMTTPCK